MYLPRPSGQGEYILIEGIPMLILYFIYRTPLCSCLCQSSLTIRARGVVSTNESGLYGAVYFMPARYIHRSLRPEVDNNLSSRGPVINYGEGGAKTGGGQVKFYPCEKKRGRGEAEQVLAMLKGRGHNTFVGSLNTVAKRFRPIKGGPEKLFPVLKGWGWG